MVGRTHGVHAEPITLGLKFALWHAEFQRQRSAGSCSPGDGQRRQALRRGGDLCASASRGGGRGLRPPGIGPRAHRQPDHPAGPARRISSALALLGGSIEKAATGNSDTCSAPKSGRRRRPSGRGRRAPAPCPTNAIRSQRKPLRPGPGAEGQRPGGLENMALWHERDISHSSAERVIIPDSSILADFMLARLTGLLKKLVVHPEHMQANLNLSRGLVFSQTLLLALVQKGSAGTRPTVWCSVRPCRCGRQGGNLPKESQRTSKSPGI
jgi:adenylosuccinate lyase